jgi:hypothetical protein
MAVEEAAGESPRFFIPIPVERDCQQDSLGSLQPNSAEIDHIDEQTNELLPLCLDAKLACLFRRGCRITDRTCEPNHFRPRCLGL